MNLNNKFRNAIITGASSGIGLEFAKQLSQAGLNLLLISRNKEKLEQIKSNIESNNVKIFILNVDLTADDSVGIILNFLQTNNFEPDLLINNAGAGVFGNFEITDLNKEIELIKLNIIAVTKLCKMIITQMKRGTILNVSSTIAFRKSPQWAVYSATKAYVLSITKSLSLEFKNKQIKFSVLCPGKTVSSFDSIAGFNDQSNSKKSNTSVVVSYSIKQLINDKTIIIPGIRNKIKYFIFKYFPEYITDILIKPK